MERPEGRIQKVVSQNEEEKSINGLWNKKVRDISYESIPVD